MTRTQQKAVALKKNSVSLEYLSSAEDVLPTSQQLTHIFQKFLEMISTTTDACRILYSLAI